MAIDFGNVARIRRKELGLSQQEVADMAFCHRETVSIFENNIRSVGIDIVQSIFEVLGLKIVVEEA